MKKRLTILFTLFVFLFLLQPCFASGTEPSVNIRQSFITMKDGVKLSATFFEPKQISPSEKLPVLLELLPYRKDDTFYMRDYPLHTYFAEHGFISVKVDIRGTGSSEGKLPDREYSDAEIEDAICLIDKLSKLPNSNGKVGMWGISWGAFNAIQVAMRHPPALGAILAAHVSDDLYHDDVHYQDGSLHFDWYNLEIDHENGLPKSPDYKLDSTYFKNRFEAYPWLLTYLHQQRDGDYWRKNSLRWQFEKLDIPVYLIGGLLDGYRDSVLRMLTHLKVPIKAEIGPWNHSWPDNGTPGPNYEWRANACEFFKHWLDGKKNASMDNRFLVYVREGNEPNDQLKTAPGHWQYCDWPNPDQKDISFYPHKNGNLDANHLDRTQSSTLSYQATKGHQAGFWWGEPTDDMRDDDAYSFTFDTTPLEKKVEIIGFPKIKLRASCTAPQANFIARLEDVFPDGRVSLVTGGMLNSSQRESSLNPLAMEKGKEYDLEWDLHFTTWTFQPGHKIRLAITNSQFPMVWPSPHKMASTIYFGEQTRLILPKTNPHLQTVNLPKPEKRAKRPDTENFPETTDIKLEENLVKNTVTWSEIMQHDYDLLDKNFSVTRKLAHSASAKEPAKASFHGNMQTLIKNKKEELGLITDMKVNSDLSNFYVTFKRELKQNGKPIRTKVWTETIKRDFQ